MEQIEIPLSKMKILLLLLGAIGFVVMGCALMGGVVADGSWFVVLLGLVSVLFFGAATIVGFKKLLDHKPGLIINEEGIFDNSTGVTVGQINWKDIKRIRVGQVKSTRFLLIDLHNPKEYIQRANALGRKLMKGNQRAYGTPISIPSNSLKCSFKKLEKLVRDHFANYQSKLK